MSGGGGWSCRRCRRVLPLQPPRPRCGTTGPALGHKPRGKIPLCCSSCWRWSSECDGGFVAVCQGEEGKKHYGGEPTAHLAATARRLPWLPSHARSLYFLLTGLPDAGEPAERDHRHSRFGFPSGGSEGWCLLSFCGKESSEFLPEFGQVQALLECSAQAVLVSMK